jgi:2-iminobutanoate/2-iminopropanoate deaminase
VRREIIRVEPLSTYLENWKAPTSAVTRSGDTIYVSGFRHSSPTLALWLLIKGVTAPATR